MALGIVGGFFGLMVLGVAAGGGGDGTERSPATAASGAGGKADKPEGTPEDAAPAAKKVVTFKVWGTAANGVDITYGSDSDSRDGKFANGSFEATLPLKKDAMYYTVMGQLSGGGDIHCSVSVNGKTKKAHASGGYNICDAQLNGGLLGGWD